ncbi:hypothetical protein ACIF8T_36735 [Streptomyces sp. NPDC085946]
MRYVHRRVDVGRSGVVAGDRHDVHGVIAGEPPYVSNHGSGESGR